MFSNDISLKLLLLLLLLLLSVFYAASSETTTRLLLAFNLSEPILKLKLALFFVFAMLTIETFIIYLKIYYICKSMCTICFRNKIIEERCRKAFLY